ncbi:MAG: hypothetical protein J0H64_00375 [Actinobacteria bacterium]|nr:hypothetical protein [Actinomycetota bacterium]
MKTRFFGALLGLALGFAVVCAVPSAAQAAWSTFFGNASINQNAVKTSGAGTVGHAQAVFYMTYAGVSHQRIVQQVTKGKIVADGTGSSGGWFTVTATPPTANTVAKCWWTHPSGSGLVGQATCRVDK